MYDNNLALNLKEKEIITSTDLLAKLDNPVSKSLYLYLEERRPRSIAMSDFSEQVFRTKAAACRILMMMAAIELERLGYLKDSIHKHDRIEFIYA